MTGHPRLLDVEQERALHAWQAPLPIEQQQALQALYERETQAWAAMDVGDRAQADPLKACLAESARRWLAALHAVWMYDARRAKESAKDLDAHIQTLAATDLTFHALNEVLWAHCLQAALQMLWEHERTKLWVRGGASNKKTFLQSSLLQEMDVFDMPAVLQTLAQASAKPEALTAQRQTIAAALRTLGHFTSKPTHTSASAIGIVLSPQAHGIGPYLTAGLVQDHGHTLWLDQTINDNTGRTGSYREVLNGENAQADAATAASVREVAAELFADGHEHGTDAIDPRLRQILLPVVDGHYRAVTPVTSLGLSAYLHSHWQPWEPNADEESYGDRQSFGQLVFYGFSTTAIGNFTAIRRVPHALEPDKTIGNLPNRALLFDVPRLDEAHATLARTRHRGYRPHLPKGMGDALFEQYLTHRAILNNDTVAAIETERRLYRPVLRFMWQDLLRQRAQCADALDDLDDVLRAEILAMVTSQPTAVKFLLAGMTGESGHGVAPRALAEHLAGLLLREVEQFKDGKDKTLGLSVSDRQRFMRWAPDAIAHMFSQR